MEKKDILTINSTVSPYKQYLPYFYLKELDESFSSINDIYIARNNEFMAINDDMYCLVPYLSKSLNPCFYIIKPNYYKYNNKILLDINRDNAIIRKIKPNLNQNSLELYYITSHYNSFFVNIGHNLFIGNYKKVLDKSISQIINVSDSLIAFRIKNQTYLSLDKGESW